MRTDSYGILLFVSNNYTPNELSTFQSLINNPSNITSTFVQDVLDGDYDSLSTSAGVAVDRDASSIVTVSGDIAVSGTVDGRDVLADGTKLDGIEASADVTDATSVASAGAAMLTGADFTGDVRIADDTELKFGDSTNGDLRIFHTSSNNTSTIREQGSSAFLIQGQDLYLSDTSGDNYLYGQSGADVRLYFNGSPKLNTRDTGVNFTGDITLTGTVDGRDVATDGTKLDGLKGTLTHNYWDSLQWQQGASRVLTTTLTQYGDQQSVKHQNSTYKTYVDLSLDLTYNSAAGTNDAYGYLSVTAPPPTGETTVNMGTCTLVSSGVTYITAFTVVGDWTEYFSRYVGISKNSNGSNAMGFPYKWVYSPNANTTTVWVSGFGNPPFKRRYYILTSF